MSAWSVRQSIFLLGLAVAVLSLIGAMLALAGPKPLLEQRDDLPGSGEHEIYYPYPYKRTPNLRVERGSVVEQRPDGFSVIIEPPPPEPPRRDAAGIISLEEVMADLRPHYWRASGIPLDDPRPFWETMPAWGWTCFLGVLAGLAAAALSFVNLAALQRPRGGGTMEAEGPALTSPSAGFGGPARRIWESLRK